MNIEINDKTYEINTNIRFGVMELLNNQPENPKAIRLFLKEALIPAPTNEDIFDFREDDIIEVGDIFRKERERKESETKKKLSR